MIHELIVLIKEQDNKLEELLVLLQLQYEFIINKNLFGLEDLVGKINDCGKRVGQAEVKRRNLIGNISLTQLISEQNNDELNKVYENIKKTLNAVKIKKETNDLLIKQRLSFNSRMLSILNPNREIKTYNSYGSLRR